MINSVCVSDASIGGPALVRLRRAAVVVDSANVGPAVGTIEEVVTRGVVSGVGVTDGVVVGRALRPDDRCEPIAIASTATMTNAATTNTPGRRGEPNETT